MCFLFACLSFIDDLMVSYCLTKSMCKSVLLYIMDHCAQNDFQVLKHCVVSCGLLMVDLRSCIVSGSWRRSRRKAVEIMKRGSDYMTSGCLQVSSRILEPQHGEYECEITSSTGGHYRHRIGMSDCLGQDIMGWFFSAVINWIYWLRLLCMKIAY